MTEEKCNYILNDIRAIQLPRLKTLMNDILVNQQKGFYTSQKVIYIQYLYLFLLIIYIGIWLGSIFILSRNVEVDNIKKFGIVAILFILPFLSLNVLIYVLSFIRYIYQLVPKNAYLL